MSIPKDAKGGHANTSPAAVQEAAAWLATTPRERITNPIIPTLRRQFGLSAVEAVEAVRQAQVKQARAT